ncbi:F-box/kelch-repeat protein At3g23880-like [Vicia villosa]|uniref:F-box/kelch-repeat protein At3g23880-like n=1 Tax=Vicia villosa TaxID=3911 RepID=UPI00273AC11C|nr:F-box/kelch-repeat protein At3g23880-like [Vicia villosa]
MYCRGHQNGTVLTLSPNGDDLCSHLPEELIVEILLRLPVRSLLQLKCICKLWKTLVSDSKFVKRHLQISTVEPNLIHQRLFFYHLGEPCKILHIPLKTLFGHLLPPVSSSGMTKHPYWIIGSCNGLLCLYDRTRHCVKLFNPSIMFKSKKSPSAFSLDWMIRHHGFGYDQVNDKYKVLLVMRNKNDPSQPLTKIYTFGEDSWKIIQNLPGYPQVYLGKFVSGTLNWIAGKRGVILSFDFEKETYKEVLFPQDDGDNETLYVLNDCLGVCHVSNKTNWIAWLMKEYGVVESWTKFMIISLDKFNKQPSSVIPTFVSKNVVLLKNEYTSQFIRYNLSSGQLDYLLKSTNNIRINLHICYESLVSLPW